MPPQRLITFALPHLFPEASHSARIGLSKAGLVSPLLEGRILARRVGAIPEPALFYVRPELPETPGQILGGYAVEPELPHARGCPPHYPPPSNRIRRPEVVVCLPLPVLSLILPTSRSAFGSTALISEDFAHPGWPHKRGCLARQDMAEFGDASA